MQPDHIKFLDFDPTPPQRALDLDAISERSACAAWNEHNPVGTPVRYWPGDRGGRSLVGRTRGRAALFGGHTAVVWVDSTGSAIALTHVERIDEAELDAARAERTESATGEDVEVVKAAIRSVTRGWMLDSDLDVIAPAILAALDLPALRAALGEAERQIDLLGAANEAYWAAQQELDRLLGTEKEDGSGLGLAGEVRLLGEQRDQARNEAEALRSQHVLGAQLAHLTRSLTEALAERDQARDDLARWHKKEAGNE